MSLRGPARPDAELVQLVVQDGASRSDLYPSEAETASLVPQHSLLAKAQAAGSWRTQLSKHRNLLIGVGVALVVVAIVATVLGVRHARGGQLYQAPAPPGPSLPPGTDPYLANGLGPVWWPPSPNTTDTANAHFVLGLRLLHVFWYDLATKEFEATISADPSFWGGYWGVAACSKQALWMTEDHETANKALQGLDSKVNIKALPAKEQQYIQAMKTLWAQGQSMEQRERAYSKAMAALYTQYPDDPDTCGFYTLSLLSMTANSADYLQGEEKQQVMSQARSVLATCSARWWDHAGLLHYVTHAHDVSDPEVVKGGLAAGVHLSEVAPAACHAQHMKSHLFLQLGSWSQVVDSNYKAVKASDYYCNKYEAGNGLRLRACDKDDRYHALEWWMYGLTQQCAWRDALALLGRSVEIYRYTNSSSPYSQWALRMWSHIVMQSQAGLTLPPVPPLMSPLRRGNTALMDSHTVLTQVVQAANATLPTDLDVYWEIHARASALVAAAYATTLWSNTSSSGTQGPLTSANVASLFTAIQATMKKLNASVPSDMHSLRDMVSVLALQLEALQGASDCLPGTSSDCGAWLAPMDKARTKEAAIWGKGPSLQITPAMEMEGHLLLATLDTQKDTTDSLKRAQQRFSECLKRLPNRQSCILGQARAASALGNAPSATQWYLTLWQQCAPVAAPQDFLWPGLVEAYWELVPPDKRSETAAATAAAVAQSAGVGQSLGWLEGTGNGVAQMPHQHYYTYGGVITYVALTDDMLATSPSVYQAATASRAPPFPSPADMDPRNAAALASANYMYPYLGLPLPTGVQGFPPGRVMYSAASRVYTYIEMSGDGQAGGDGYWPDVGMLYSEARSNATNSKASG